MKKIVKIFSDDNRFSRMLELELGGIGIDVLQNDVPYCKELESQLFYVIDLDSFDKSDTQMGEIADVTVYFSKDRSKMDQRPHKSAIYFSRPFSMSDFLSAFEDSHAVQAKSLNNSVVQNEVTYINVSHTDKTAVFGNLKIPLSDNEYKILALLCKNRGKTVDRERINSLIGAKDGNIGDVYICHLRKKLDNRLGLKLIYTIRGAGYMLKS